PAHPGDVDEPRHDLDPAERAVIGAGRGELAHQLADHVTGEQLDVVVADDDVDAVAGGGEPAELGEQRSVSLADPPHALDPGLDAAAQAKPALVGGPGRALRGPGDHDRHEIEQITGDHQ